MIRNGAVAACGTVVLLLTLLVAACTDSLPWSVHVPADLLTPLVAGVVEEISRLPDGRVSYRLKNGETVIVASQKDVLLGGEPLIDELLLTGIEPSGGEWIAGVSGDWPGRPSGCFLFPAQGRANDGWIETNGGFRLPKAADFYDARDHPDDVFASDRGVFCLNERGEVTYYDIG